jgi:hypothetical protein
MFVLFEVCEMLVCLPSVMIVYLSSVNEREVTALSTRRKVSDWLELRELTCSIILVFLTNVFSTTITDQAYIEVLPPLADNA